MSTIYKEINQIKVDVPFKCFPWKDHNDHLTVGYGRNLELNTITLEEASALLENDLEWCEAQLRGNVYNYQALPSEVQQILLNLFFSIGHGFFGDYEKMIHELILGQYKKASKLLRKSLFYKADEERVERLAKRLDSLSRQFLPKVEWCEKTKRYLC